MSVEELRARRLHPPGADKVSPRFELIPVEPVGQHEGTTMVYDSRTGAHVVAGAVDTYPPSPRGDQLRRVRIGGFHPDLRAGAPSFREGRSPLKCLELHVQSCMVMVVLVRKAFRYRVYPTPAQVGRLRGWEHSLRWLWNKAHEQRLLAPEQASGESRHLTVFDQQAELTSHRANLPWLDDVPRDVCNQLLVELDKAWQRYHLKLTEEPNFKCRGRDRLGFCEPHPKAWRLDGDVIRFPKLGNLRAVIHRPLEGKPKTCTLREEAGQWFASIVCEIEVADPVPRAVPAIALDRGVANLIADSDGGRVPNPKHMEAAQKRLARAQRTVDRRMKGSKNREKAKRRVAVLHRKVRRQRAHELHRISARLSKSHAIVVVEKLNIAAMTKSAAGTAEDPGTNVAQKRGLSRAILSMGWGILVNQCRYKLAWTGGSVVEVPAAYSSHTCHGCGHVAAESRVSQARFECVNCGLVEHADVNAAKVLLQRFQTPGNPWCLPVEGSPRGTRRSRKQLRVVRRKVESLAL